MDTELINTLRFIKNWNEDEFWQWIENDNWYGYQPKPFEPIEIPGHDLHELLNTPDTEYEDLMTNMPYYERKPHPLNEEHLAFKVQKNKAVLEKLLARTREANLAKTEDCEDDRIEMYAEVLRKLNRSSLSLAEAMLCVMELRS